MPSVLILFLFSHFVRKFSTFRKKMLAGDNVLINMLCLYWAFTGWTLVICSHLLDKRYLYFGRSLQQSSRCVLDTWLNSGQRSIFAKFQEQKKNEHDHRMKKCLFPGKQAQFSPIWIVFICTKMQNFPPNSKISLHISIFLGNELPKFPIFSHHEHDSGHLS